MRIIAVKLANGRAVPAMSRARDPAAGEGMSGRYVSPSPREGYGQRGKAALFLCPVVPEAATGSAVNGGQRATRVNVLAMFSITELTPSNLGRFQGSLPRYAQQLWTTKNLCLLRSNARKSVCLRATGLSRARKN